MYKFFKKGIETMSYTKRCFDTVDALDNTLGEYTLKAMQEFFTDGTIVDEKTKEDYHQRVIDLWKKSCDDVFIGDEEWLCISIMLWLTWENRDEGCNPTKIAKHFRLEEIEKMYS